MKAATYDHYGPSNVLQIQTVARPEIGPHDVLVRVRASSVTSGDWRMRASAFPGAMWLPGRLFAGLFRPRHKILGSEVAGEIVAAGDAVTRFEVGDDVFGYCGRGSNAEYVAVAENGFLERKPPNLSYGEAAGVPNGALTAHHFLTKVAELKRGQKILIIGASGGVGTYAVQLAKHLGAHVTGVSSGRNLALVESLGADAVVDYETQDFRAMGARYDVVFDTVGATTFAECKGVLTPSGALVCLEFGPQELWQMARTCWTSGRKVRCSVTVPTREAMAFIAGLLERRQLIPVVDRAYSLDEIRAAHAYVEQRRKRGSVVIEVVTGSYASKNRPHDRPRLLGSRPADDETHPELLHHRARRPRQVDAR